MEPTQNPPVNQLRLGIQFNCGCTSFVDIPQSLIAQAETDGLSAGDAKLFVFGQYMTGLYTGLYVAPHDFCPEYPATYFSKVAEENHDRP